LLLKLKKQLLKKQRDLKKKLLRRWKRIKKN